MKNEELVAIQVLFGIIGPLVSLVLCVFLMTECERHRYDIQNVTKKNISTWHTPPSTP